MTSRSSIAERRLFLGFAGGAIVADDYGPNAAPAVLLLHGSGQTRHAWGNTARSLGADGWRAVALDLPGHGESCWSLDGDYRTPTLAEPMSRIWRELGQPLVVVGASLGGLISIATTARADAPPIVGLVLVDIAPQVAEAGRSRVRNFMTAHPDGFATLEEAARHIAEYRGRPTDDRLEGLKKNLRLDKRGRWVWHWDPQLVSESNRKNRPDAEWYERALRALNAPTLLVRGLRSDVVSDESVRALREAVPNVGFVDLQGVGHMVAGDANDAFTASVAAFLHQVMPPAATSN